MTARRQDLGTERDPIQAGNPYLLQVNAVTDSGHVGSLSILDLTTAEAIEYAVFRFEGTQPVPGPLFVMSVMSGTIEVTSIAGGAFNVPLPASATGLLTGRDWHVCRYRDFDGNPYDIFDGYVVSTVALSFEAPPP